MSDNGRVVELEEVAKVYQQGKHQVEALRGVTMAVNKGEFMAISGPSGSGKTTALNLIGALDTPTSGAIRIDGTDLGTLNRKELSRLRRDRIGFVFQAYNLLPILSAYENAEIVMAVQGVEETERRRRRLKARWARWTPTKTSRSSSSATRLASRRSWRPTMPRSRIG